MPLEFEVHGEYTIYFDPDGQNGYMAFTRTSPFICVRGESKEEALCFALEGLKAGARISKGLHIN